MLSRPPTVQIFLYAGPTDMRKGFDSLAHVVESSLALDPLPGHLFVFRSRRVGLVSTWPSTRVLQTAARTPWPMS
jgi:transposase